MEFELISYSDFFYGWLHLYICALFRNGIYGAKCLFHVFSYRTTLQIFKWALETCLLTLAFVYSVCL